MPIEQYQLTMFVMQGVLERFTDIVVTVGSGGTASGLAIGNYLTGSKLKYVHIMSLFRS